MNKIRGGSVLFILLISCSNRAVPSNPDGAFVIPQAPNQNSDEEDQQEGLQGCALPWTWTRYWEEGRTFAKPNRQMGGLPAGGEDWRCHPYLLYVEGCWDCKEEIRWICIGNASDVATSSTCGWTCWQVTIGGQKLMRCEKKEGPEDLPPDGVSCPLWSTESISGCYVCAKSSFLEGTVCEQREKPIGYGFKETCSPGQKMRCDDLIYDGWGIVRCDPATRTWKTKNYNGHPVLDCQFDSEENLPNTWSACYSPYFFPFSCERIDCVVPEIGYGEDTTYQNETLMSCPHTSGQLCDYCREHEDCREPGAKCIFSQVTSESFCGRSCDGAPCPVGFSCEEINLPEGKTKQCVPEKLSCYFDRFLH